MRRFARPSGGPHSGPPGMVVTSPLRAHPCSSDDFATSSSEPPRIQRNVDTLAGTRRSRPPAAGASAPPDRRASRVSPAPPASSPASKPIASARWRSTVRIGEARVPRGVGEFRLDFRFRSISLSESAHVRRAPNPRLACRSAGETGRGWPSAILTSSTASPKLPIPPKTGVQQALFRRKRALSGTSDRRGAMRRRETPQQRFRRSAASCGTPRRHRALRHRLSIGHRRQPWPTRKRNRRCVCRWRTRAPRTQDAASRDSTIP